MGPGSAVGAEGNQAGQDLKCAVWQNQKHMLNSDEIRDFLNVL